MPLVIIKLSLVPVKNYIKFNQGSPWDSGIP